MYDQTPRPDLRGLPLSARDHLPRGLAVFPISISLRMVEELLAARGIEVSYATVRQWRLKFGEVFAHRVRQRAPQRGDKWPLGEVVIAIAGRKHWL